MPTVIVPEIARSPPIQNTTAVPIAVDQPERDEQHPAVHRGGDADVAHAGRTARELVALAIGRPNSLASIAPATLKRSAVMLFISAFCCMPMRASSLDARAEAARGVDERGQCEQG